MAAFFSAHLLLYLLPLISIANGVLVNVTVDDASADPLTGQTISYLPDNAWHQGATCSGCTAAVDRQRMYLGTWHDGTYFSAASSQPRTGPLSITFKFNGTAIYVFCALGLASSSTLTAYSNMTFYIDDELVGQFERIPPGLDGFDYNVSVYSNTSLAPGNHQFMLQNGQFGDAGSESLTLFDYLVYSYDNGLDALATTSSSSPTSKTPIPSTLPPDSQSSTPVSAIAGGVVGGVVGLALIALVIWWFLFRRKETNLYFPDPSMTMPKPYNMQANASQPLMGYPYGSNAPVISVGAPPAASSSSLGGKFSRPSFVSPGSSSASEPFLYLPRERDAGPLVLASGSEHEGTLPPDYGQIFEHSNSGSIGVR